MNELNKVLAIFTFMAIFGAIGVVSFLEYIGG